MLLNLPAPLPARHSEHHRVAYEPQHVTNPTFSLLDARGLITTGNSAPLTCEGQNGSAETYRYSGAIPCEHSGQYGCALRIVPCQPPACRPPARP